MGVKSVQFYARDRNFNRQFARIGINIYADGPDNDPLALLQIPQTI